MLMRVLNFLFGIFLTCFLMILTAFLLVGLHLYDPISKIVAFLMLVFFLAKQWNKNKAFVWGSAAGIIGMLFLWYTLYISSGLAN